MAFVRTFFELNQQIILFVYGRVFFVLGLGIALQSRRYSRLDLAIALLADPLVLLLDEPTASLDAKAQRDYLTRLTALRTEEHKTILFASHRLEEVEALANRVLVLEQGCLVEALHPVDLLAKLMPQIQLTLWVPEAQRPDALANELSSKVFTLDELHVEVHMKVHG